MSTAATQLITRLKECGIVLWKEGQNLRYKAPKDTLTSALLDEIKQCKQELLALLEESEFQPIAKIPDASRYQLSHAQRRMWILAQLTRASATYNVPLHQLLDGELNYECLQQAFMLIINRHESLRTTFSTVDGEPFQVVHQTVPCTIVVIDVASESDPIQKAHEMASRETGVAFNLETGPLFRISLVKVAANRNVLLLTLHHSICDGTSIGILAYELSIAYDCLVKNRPVTLPPLPIQYRDFSAWQNNMLTSSSWQNHRQYWLNKLRSPLPVLDLATDYPRPAVQSYDGAELSLTINPQLYESIKTIARQNNCSMFMMLTALVKVLLYRYTNQEEILLGSPVAGRIHPDTENCIGLFLNTVTLRDTLHSDDSFLSVLSKVRATISEALDHQEYPFDLLIDELGVERNLGRSPLFDVMLILQNQNDAGPRFDSLQATPFFGHSGTSKTDITFCFKESPQGLIMAVEYATRLFGAQRINRMMKHFCTLIQSVTADPSQRISTINIVPPDERTLLLTTWNDTAKTVGNHETILQAIAAVAKQYPHATAVVCNGKSVTYAQLMDRVNTLASVLMSFCSGPDHRIAVCVERSLDMLVSLLAVMRIRCAYIPLDPIYPHERLCTIIEDCEASLLIVSASLREKNFVSAAKQSLVIDTVEQLSVPRQIVPDISEGKGSDTAYIIYTSGSTGKPKGVQIEQHSLVNVIIGMNDLLKLGTHDTCVSVTTISFDIAALELYLPLTVGARVVIADRQTTVHGTLLAECLDKWDATVMQATPSGWRLLIDAGWRGRSALTALCGGESLSVQLAEKICTRVGKVWNVYGPTETTIWSSAYRIEKTSLDTSADATVSIGRPICNTTMYVLDAAGEMVPIGVPGELFIGGEGCARGYWQRPELTAERFVPSPFEQSQKLYRTGDRVKYRDDGSLEFLGRIDFQVKIRGFRIELGEIEATLRMQSSVVDAVVVAHADSRNDTFLAAYVTTDKQIAADAARITAWKTALREKLPEYMVPQSITVLASFPQTPNGKVDRKALPKPSLQSTGMAIVERAPRNQVETTIARVWETELATPVRSIDLNFFDVGGQSLKAARVAFALQREFSIEIQLIDIFTYATVASLAQEIDRRLEMPDKNEQSCNASNSSMSIKTVDASLDAELTTEELEML